MAQSRFDEAMLEIDRNHCDDPTKSSNDEPYEMHYAKRMSHYLHKHSPDASPLLCLAVRAQHFRRWEVPRDTYPKTKVGYFSWRTFQKKKAAEEVEAILLKCSYSDEEAARVASLIAKEDLKKGEGNGDPEVQVLEDCACLVFLDDQFDSYEAKWAEDHGSQEEADEKMVSILRKTWAKMGQRGRDIALEMHMSAKQQALVSKALTAT